MHSRTADELGLPHVAERHDQSEGGDRIGQSDHPRDVTQRPVQPQLATESETLGAIRVHSPAATSRPTAMGRSSPAPPLRTPEGARFVVILRMGQGRSLDRMAADVISSLADRGVGQTDDGEAGQPIGDLDLNRDTASDGAAQNGGSD